MKSMIVIGAGAAGMMTAIKASQNYKVTIIEKNDKPGKKLYITGKGRCNLTNNSDEETFLKNVVTNPKFMYSAIYSYNQAAVISDFINWGVSLKSERGNRVFPSSDKSSDIIRTLTNQLKKRKVDIRYNTKVTNIVYKKYRADILDKNDKYEYIATGVEIKNGSKKEVLEADVIVLASGGSSYPQTGSSGDGYNFLREMGVEITPVRPALVPLEIKESYPEKMMGLALKNVKIRVIADKKDYPSLKKTKVLYEDFGEMLFTHFGVSGPLCLSASSYISSFLYNKSNLLCDTKLHLYIDLKPALTEEELDKRILRDWEEYHNRDFQNSLGKLLPRLMIPVIIKLSGISPDKKVNVVTATERATLVKLLKGFHLTINGLRDFNEAIITGGGVAVKEINPQNMELKKVKNLRVAGEVIDVDALTGGFNLQIAWSTANLAAE